MKKVHCVACSNQFDADAPAVGRGAVLVHVAGTTAPEAFVCSATCARVGLSHVVDRFLPTLTAPAPDRAVAKVADPKPLPMPDPHPVGELPVHDPDAPVHGAAPVVVESGAAHAPPATPH